ncbi:hypothetical protein [Halorarum halobium]|uniref:hypothetical protein n=1 Tax=Halorarum halobium TaxID=3075121 RepID=UPI0028A75D22|nr:hypothetical protein [Halobaculum sp. XH14]
MISGLSGTEVSSVVLAALIALFPILYPKYSLFIKEARIGIESLRDWDETGIQNDQNNRVQKQSYLEPGDTGFSQIEAALDDRIPPNRTIKRFIQIHSDKPDSRGGIAFGGGSVRSIEQAVFLAEFENDDSQILLQRPFEIESILELDELEQIVRNQAKARAHQWTVFLVLVWTGISIISTT